MFIQSSLSCWKHLKTQLKFREIIEYTDGIYNFYVYILTNKHKTVLYTGVTNDLKRDKKEALIKEFNPEMEFLNSRFV